MELSVGSLLTFTKLVVRDPAAAMRLLKDAGLSRDAGLILMVLAGVISGLIKGVINLFVPSRPMEVDMGDGTAMVFFQPGALGQGIFAAVSGLAMAFALYHVGRRMGGQGTWPQILSLVAGLQMVMVVILVAQTFVMLISPMMALFVLMFGLYVFFRGLGHVVNVGHEFGDMGRSVGAIVVSFIGLTVAMLFVATLFGAGSFGELR